MTSLFGIALLPLWIMGVPVIGALISLAMPAPRGNTMPRLRYQDGTPVHRDNDVATATTAPTATATTANVYPRT
ncbi:hypothetical protein [Blastomonas sp.]|uniref:hypothetical protein n=1 Tax=Blastomonas sp. TaxID=1909299 RepID=UPI00391B28E8